jgi:hypothetical protein
MLLSDLHHMLRTLNGDCGVEGLQNIFPAMGGLPTAADFQDSPGRVSSGWREEP